MKKVYDIAWDFICEVLIRMKEYLPLKDEVLLNCDVLLMTKVEKSKWINLAKYFYNIIPPSEMISLQHQLELFTEDFEELRTLYDKENNKVKFWNALGIEYSLIKKLALMLITLPYSTVGIERTFSMLRDIKTSKRNRLSVESVEANLLIRNQIKDMDEYIIGEDMLQNYRMMWKLSSAKKESKKIYQKDHCPAITLSPFEHFGPQSELIVENSLDYDYKESGKKRIACNPLSREFNNPLKREKRSNSQ